IFGRPTEIETKHNPPPLKDGLSSQAHLRRSFDGRSAHRRPNELPYQVGRRPPCHLGELPLTTTVSCSVGSGNKFWKQECIPVTALCRVRRYSGAARPKLTVLRLG